MRLQVFLSHSGVCSRRKAFDLVTDGSVTVNGKVIREPSCEVSLESDNICVAGKKITLKKKVYLLLNKPPGFVTTVKDRHARSTVMELLPKEYGHLYPVGRLDKDSEGLLLLTNDGDAAFRLLHPRFSIDKIYFVEIDGYLKKEDVSRLRKGVVIDGRRTYPARIDAVRTMPERSSFNITIHEGRKRQIRLMLASLGYRVSRLRRIQYGPLKLDSLRPRAWRLLTESEISLLRSACGLDKGGLQ